jgi:hypothetical protein
MKCPSCGAQNDPNAWRCAACGTVLQQAPAAPPAGQAGRHLPIGAVPNYLVQAILATLFCNQLLGIPAIVYACQVNTKLAQGDLFGAQAASRSAKLWCWVAFGCWLVLVGLFTGIFLLGALASFSGK